MTVRSEAARRGIPVIGTRWIDVNKGDQTKPNLRSRLVAQEFAAGDPREDLFAGTPPLFAARMLVSQVVSCSAQNLTLMVLDITCAFLMQVV